MLSHRVHEHPSLPDVERERLLGVDILARLAGLDAGEHPLELPRADDDGVDVLVIEQATMILVDGPGALPLRLVRLGPRQIAVAEGDDFRLLRQLVEQESGAVADPDRPDTHAVAGGRPGRTALRPGHRDRRGPERSGHEQLPSVTRSSLGVHRHARGGGVAVASIDGGPGPPESATTAFTEISFSPALNAQHTGCRLASVNPPAVSS